MRTKTEDKYRPQIGISYANGFPMNYRVGDHIINPMGIDINTGRHIRTGRPVKQSRLESQ